MKKLVLATALLCWGAHSVAVPAPVVEAGSAVPVRPLTTDDRVERLERQMKARSQAQLQLQQVLDQMQRELGQLRGQLEDQNYQIEQMLNRQRQLYKELARVQAAPAAPKPTATVKTGPVVSISEADAYNQALDLATKERRFDDAIPAFQNFLKTYPESSYAPNGYYWLGQVYYIKGQMSEAQAMFTSVVDKYPKSGKRSDSLLKLGLIAKQQGNKQGATQFFNQVVTQYADSSAAKLAQKQLK